MSKDGNEKNQTCKICQLLNRFLVKYIQSKRKVLSSFEKKNNEMEDKENNDEILKTKMKIKIFNVCTICFYLNREEKIKFLNSACRISWQVCRDCDVKQLFTEFSFVKIMDDNIVCNREFFQCRACEKVQMQKNKIAKEVLRLLRENKKRNYNKISAWDHDNKTESEKEKNNKNNGIYPLTWKSKKEKDEKKKLEYSLPFFPLSQCRRRPYAREKYTIDIPMKVCRVCRLYKSIEDFNFDYRSIDKHQHICRYCWPEYKKLQKTKKNIYPYTRAKMKICARCKIKKPMENFSPDQRKKDKRRDWCRLCRNIRIAELRKKRQENEKNSQEEEEEHLEKKKKKTEKKKLISKIESAPSPLPLPQAIPISIPISIQKSSEKKSSSTSKHNNEYDFPYVVKKNRSYNNNNLYIDTKEQACKKRKEIDYYNENKKEENKIFPFPAECCFNFELQAPSNYHYHCSNSCSDKNNWDSACNTNIFTSNPFSNEFFKWEEGTENIINFVF